MAVLHRLRQRRRRTARAEAVSQVVGWLRCRKAALSEAAQGCCPVSRAEGKASAPLRSGSQEPRAREIGRPSPSHFQSTPNHGIPPATGLMPGESISVPLYLNIMANLSRRTFLATGVAAGFVARPASAQSPATRSIDDFFRDFTADWVSAIRTSQPARVTSPGTSRTVSSGS